MSSALKVGADDGQRTSGKRKGEKTMNYEKSYKRRPVPDITPGVPVAYMQFRDTILTLHDIRIYNPAPAPKVKVMFKFPTIKNVIFNDPATIVFWADGSKTVVKCQGDDIFDPEKGLAMAISKKALGNKSNFNNVFKKWLPEEPSISLSTPMEYTLTLNVDPETLKSAFTRFGGSWKNNAQTERSESDNED